jgi:NADH-quinone oxidoreductase subunit A
MVGTLAMTSLQETPGAAHGLLASHPYTPVLVLLLVVIGLVVVIITLSQAIGTKRHGPRKDAPYEAGMPPVGDARRRFHVRFYIVALLFLLFDVEVVLLWPWAVAFHHSATTGELIKVGDATYGKTFLLIGAGVFFVLLVVGLIYEWGRKALRWT